MYRASIPLLAALLTVGCQMAGKNDRERPAAPAKESVPVVNQSDPGVPPPPHMDLDAPPPAGDTTVQGAVRRALEYCDALATRRFGDAYSLWSDSGRASGMSLDQFTAKFADTNVSDCQLGDVGPPEGAAGSIYVEVPAVMRGSDATGQPMRIEGSIVLRRVNDVPGSTGEQRRWHIVRAEFPRR